MKLIIRLHIILLSLLFVSCDIVNEPPPSVNLNGIAVLNAFIEKDLYEDLITSRYTNLKVPVNFYYDNDKIDALIENQGSGSRYFPKFSFEIRTGGELIQGLSHFNLSAQVRDETMLRTALASHVYRMYGFPVIYSNHAFLRLNGKDRGLYAQIERINEEFFNRRNIPLSELVQVNHNARFTFTEFNDLHRSFEREFPDDDNLNNITEFINALDTASALYLYDSMNKYIDVKEYLRYHALSSVIEHSDGFTNNFLFYKRTPSSPYNFLPWDFDGAFDVDFGITFFGENDLIYKLLQSEEAFNYYKSELEYVVENIFTPEVLYPVIDSVYNKIKEAYYLDPHLGLAGYSLENEIKILKDFIISRRQYLNTNLPSFRYPVSP